MRLSKTNKNHKPNRLIMKLIKNKIIITIFNKIKLIMKKQRFIKSLKRGGKERKIRKKKK